MSLTMMIMKILYGFSDARGQRRRRALGKRDAVCGDVKTRWGAVGVEDVLETRTGLHEVEKVLEGLRLGEMTLGLVCPEVIMHEQIQHGRFTTPVERRHASLDGV